MSGASIAMMAIGIIIIWGGLAASIANAVIKSKKAAEKTSRENRDVFYFFFLSSFRSHAFR
ncbi:methionine/alanine import family NSS transporter small subunit [Bacillus sonorensis]|nr:methionine/alanine import family NSS transporter small subunit [Bacillus sonorensis]